MVSNPFQQGLSVRINGDSSGLNSAIEGAEQKLAGFKTVIGGVGAALGGLAVGGLAKSATAMADFDQAMQESIAIMGDVSDAMREDLENTAREVAQSTTASHEEAASSFYYLASAGLDAQEAMESMPDVAEFAEAGQMDMARATDVATNVMSAYGYEADEMTKITDTLSATVSNHNQTMEGMSSAMAQVAPIASSLGVSIEETSAAIGMMGDVGIQSEKAGTQLRNILSQLSDETSTASRQLEEMGVTVRDSEGDLLSMSEIITNMQESQVEAGDAAQIFGRRAGPAMAALLQEGGQAVEDNTERIREMDGATEDIAKTQRDTFNAQLEIFKSQLNDIAITIGQNILPPLTNLLDRVSEATNAFSAFNEETDGMAATLGLIGTAIGGIGVALLAFAGGPITLAIGAVAALAAAFATDFGGIRTVTEDTIGWLTQYLGSLNLAEVMDLGGIGDNLKGAFSDVEGMVSGFVDGIQPAIESVTSTLEENKPQIKQFFGIIGDAIDGLVSAFRNVLLPAIQFSLNNLIIPLINRLARLWSQHFGGMLTEIIETFEVIKARGQMFVDWFMVLWNKWGDEILGVVKYAFDGIITSIEIVIEVIWGVVETVLNIIQGDWAEAWESAKSIVVDPFNSILDFFGRWDIMGAISGAVDGVLQPFKDAFNGIVDWLKDGWGFVTSLDETMADAGKGLADGLKGAINSALNLPFEIGEVEVAGRTVTDGMTIIPALAEGGIVTEPTTAMVGEGQESEAVLPLSKLERMIDMGGGGGTQEIRVVLEEETEMVKATARNEANVEIERQGRATRRNSGRNPYPTS